MRLLSLCILLTALAAPVLADQVITKDGRSQTGRIVSEDGSGVTLDIQSGGLVMRKKIPAAQIKSISREVRDGPGYYPLPIIGVIGKDVTAEAFRAAIVEVRKHRPEY